MMRIEDYFRSVSQALAALPPAPVNRIIAELTQARTNGRRVFVFGNGGSGNSENVLRAMTVARDLGLVRIGLTGFAGGRLKELCDIAVVVPSDSMQVIEDAHLVVLHAVMVSMLCPEA